MNGLKSPEIARVQQSWDGNPKPSSNQADPQTILDTDEASYDAYLWSSRDCSEQWLAYDGPMAVVQR
jgi:hypothetical protein